MQSDIPLFEENTAHIYGCDDRFIDWNSHTIPVHQQLLEPLAALQGDAKDAGFELALASGYRDFQRQLAIWNGKANGERPVLDDNGQLIDLLQLSPWEQAQAILRWTALPGASRHHWGTDIDIYDRGAVDENYYVQLCAAEVEGDGPFTALHGWLDKQILDGHAQDFFRPYALDSGGIGTERWHLSYAPLAVELQQALSLDGLLAFLGQQPMQLKEVVLEHLEEIYHRFVVVNSECYPVEYRRRLSSDCNK